MTLASNPNFYGGGEGACVVLGGIHGGDGGVCGRGVHGRGTCVAGETATAPGGAFLLHLKFDLQNVR